MVDEDTYVQQGRDLERAYSLQVINYSSARSSPTPTSRWSATRSPTRSRTSSWASSSPTEPGGVPNPCYDVNPKFDDVTCTGRGTAGRVAIREGYIRSAYEDADEKLEVTAT